MLAINPPAVISKLGPIRLRFRAFRIACWGVLRDEAGVLSENKEALVGAPCLIGFSIGLTLAGLPSSTIYSQVIGIAVVIVSSLVSCLVHWRPNNRPLSVHDYGEIQKILASHPAWQPIVANWVVASNDHLDFRHLRALRRASAKTKRMARWTAALSGTQEMSARALLGAEMAAQIDSASLAQNTPPATSTRSPQRI